MTVRRVLANEDSFLTIDTNHLQLKVLVSLPLGITKLSSSKLVKSIETLIDRNLTLTVTATSVYPAYSYSVRC